MLKLRLILTTLLLMKFARCKAVTPDPLSHYLNLKLLFSMDENKVSENSITEDYQILSDDEESYIPKKRSAASLTAEKWPNKVINYNLNSDLDINSKGAIGAAIFYLSSKTCLKFNQDNHIPTRINFTKNYDCFSHLGMLKKDQTIGIDDSCLTVGGITSHIALSLGIIPTIQRNDRDDYIEMIDIKIKNDSEIYKKKDINDIQLYLPYEYGSMMHFSPQSSYPIEYVYRLGETVFTLKDKRFEYTTGSLMASFYDIKTINEFYNCKESCTDSTTKCENGGYPNPKDCSICVCPLGYGGFLCDQPPTDDCGVIIDADINDTEWVQVNMTSGFPTDSLTFIYNYCTKWIRVQDGYKIHLRLLKEMTNNHCEHGCTKDGIEFKYIDKESTNPRYCCGEQAKDEVISQLNPMPVISYSRLGEAQFNFEYKIVPI